MYETPIDLYLNELPDDVKNALSNLRLLIKKVIPEAEELITYQIPTFKVNNKAVVGFAAYKNHMSFFPFSGGLLGQFKEETRDYKQTKGALHFTLSKPIPDELIILMVKAKLQMIADKSIR